MGSRAPAREETVEAQPRVAVAVAVAVDVITLDGLEVKMGLGAVARVAPATEYIAYLPAPTYATIATHRSAKRAYSDERT